MMKRSINQKTKISALFLDFNGVLCSDYFYSSMKSDYSDAYQYITQDFIINSKDIINKWMVGGLNYHQVNAIISKNTGLSQKLLDTKLEESVRMMKLNSQLMDFAKQAKKKGAKTAIVTDNMDIFQKIFVPHNRLNNFFDKITSSHKYKQLKADNNGQLFDITRDHLSIDYQNTIMLDDSSKLANLMTLKGIHFYLYNNQTKGGFINWFDQRYFFG